MANTFVLLSSTVLGSSQSNISFSSIPQTYTDLVLKISSRTDASATLETILMYLNGNKSITYSWTFLRGDGSTASSSRSSSVNGFFGGLSDANGNTTSTFNSVEIYIPNYTSTTNKPISVFNAHETNGTTAYTEAIANLVPLTSAVTSINITPLSSNYITGSSFYLYGIKNS